MGDIVRVDGVQPVSLLTSHLIEQGMMRIGFLSEQSTILERRKPFSTRRRSLATQIGRAHV